MLIAAAVFFVTSRSGGGTDGAASGSNGAGVTDAQGTGDAGGSGGSGSSLFGFGSGGSDYEVGRCVIDHDPEAGAGSFTEVPTAVDCDDPEATHRILSTRATDSDTRCIDVQGATMSFEIYGDDSIHSMCLSGIDEDVDANINLVQPGKCIVIDEATEVDAYLADCGDPGSHQVLAVIDDPGYISNVYYDEITECAEAGVPEAMNIYTWGISFGGAGLGYDRAICLS